MVKTIEFNNTKCNNNDNAEKAAAPSMEYRELLNAALQIGVAKDRRNAIVEMIREKLDFWCVPEYAVENLTFRDCCHFAVAAKHRRQGIGEFLYDYCSAMYFDNDESAAEDMERYMGEVAKAYESSREILYRRKMNCDF